MEAVEAKLSVPKGFRNLLESLTLEILRERPTDIPKFAANYLRGRLVLRQERGYDECLLGSQIDGFYKYEPSRPENNLNSPTLETISTTFDTTLQFNTAKPTKSLSAKLENKDLAASKIQAGYRGYVCRQEIKAKHQAAGKIQAGYRGYACRRDLHHRDEAATVIQAGNRGDQVPRGIMGNRKVGEMNEKEGKENAKKNQAKTKSVRKFDDEDEAAIAIQAGFRGYRDRKKLARQGEASTTIQAGYRGYRDRKNLKRKHEASTTIQSGYRGYRVRRLRRSQSEAALKIQAHYRGYRVRKLRRSQSEAALKIQSQYRGYRVRKLRRSKSEAALKIQAQYRGYRVRKFLRKSSTQSLTCDKNLLEVIHNDIRSSFSLPNEDVKFEADLDSDSDVDIDEVVNKIQARTQSAEKNGQNTTEGD